MLMRLRRSVRLGAFGMALRTPHYMHAGARMEHEERRFTAVLHLNIGDRPEDFFGYQPVALYVVVTETPERE